MTHSASMYGIGEGLAPLRGGRDLGYDMYVEQAKTRAAAQASVAFQALQTGLLSQMSDSMNAIHAQMAEARQQQSEALAIQQELLNREQMQSRLEEFIYQTEKLVAECRKSTSDLPLSSRYFLLVGVLGRVRQDGISTAIIRGRDNKAAFEKVVLDTKALTQQLQNEPEVQEALQWAEQERKRLEAEQRRAEAEGQRQRAEERRVRKQRQEEIRQVENQLKDLRTSLKRISPWQVAKEHWDAFSTKRLSQPGMVPLFWIGMTVLLVCGFWIFIPIPLIACAVQAHQRSIVANKDLFTEIARVENERAALVAGRGE